MRLLGAKVQQAGTQREEVTHALSWLLCKKEKKKKGGKKKEAGSYNLMSIIHSPSGK